ncbi:MAG: GerMN domain-containing protein [Synechococcus sp.]|nr:GerMN domain-containing protein [Synechococcus sp.]
MFPRFVMVKRMILGQQLWQSFGVVAMAIALTTACTVTPNGNNSTPVPNDPPIENNTPPDAVNPAPGNPSAETPEPMVYWLKDSGDRLELAPETVTLTAETPTAQREALLTQLLTATPEAGLSSTIPPGTRLLSLVVQSDGIVVNLSADFETGGGSASMVGRVAQVLYTVTSLDPEGVVWFQIEGEPLEVLGGEGLEISQPLTREIFMADFDL